MVYVVSDLHGNYQKWLEMLKKINFSAEDTLYVIGDIGDRGSESARLFLDIMDRENVLVVRGNHEDMAQEHLEYLLRRHYENGINILELFSERDLWGWFENGGDTTLLSLFDESEEDRNRILAFIKELPYCRRVGVNGKTFVLVHGGLGEYSPGTKPEDVEPYELVWSQPDFSGTYFEEENTYLVVGHTPTFLLRGPEQPASIYRGCGNVIAIDCGAAYPEYQGRLGCLCLDTGEEFYV